MPSGAAYKSGPRWRSRGLGSPTTSKATSEIARRSTEGLEGAVLEVELRDVTYDNWEECIALRVSEAQQRMVAPNVYSLAQAKVQPECVPLAIYAGDTMVGFLMYALDRDDGNWWIYRLMIDERYQGRGYGRAALEKAIDRIRKEPGCTKIIVSLKPDNTVARTLYRSVGFVETGQQIGGEDVLCLSW